MDQPSRRTVIRIQQDRREQIEREVVREYPLRLRINGRDLATLICSPHQLNFLLAGFCHLQGFIDQLDDLLSMGICREFGLAELRIRHELPNQLQPTLTSGCGTGIVFNLPDHLLTPPPPDRRFYRREGLLNIMRALQEQTEQYLSHGGIHSAAIGDDGGLLLHAEDIGRHNTLDRLAGEALFLNFDLRDKMLVTSGRVSTEMVAKAIRLGIGLIASRTSPTDVAIDLCERAGITLIGYVRGSGMIIYCHPGQLQ